MITIKYIRQHFEEKGYVPRHCFKALKYACNTVAKKTQISAKDLFHLLIENEPIKDVHTHSYGFHTRIGRELIRSMQYEYHNKVYPL